MTLILVWRYLAFHEFPCLNGARLIGRLVETGGAFSRGCVQNIFGSIEAVRATDKPTFCFEIELAAIMCSSKLS